MVGLARQRRDRLDLARVSDLELPVYRRAPTPSRSSSPRSRAPPHERAPTPTDQARPHLGDHALGQHALPIKRPHAARLVPQAIPRYCTSVLLASTNAVDRTAPILRRGEDRLPPTTTRARLHGIRKVRSGGWLSIPTDSSPSTAIVSPDRRTSCSELLPKGSSVRCRLPQSRRCPSGSRCTRAAHALSGSPRMVASTIV